mmetsp:Transcript_1201/g.1927  ORF Transcript_1201/g.1927 Transcript_1201/m.1927 type:complete len:472 (-) Transcript_1201:24-1439(-)
MSSISGEESSDYHSSSEEDEESYNESIYDHDRNSLDGSYVVYMVGTERNFLSDLISMRANDQNVKTLVIDDSFDWIQNLTNEGWERFGRDISNSSYLRKLVLFNYFDDDNITPFFRGLTRSSSIRRLSLYDENYICFNGIQSMVPFLQNASNLLELNITGNKNNIIAEGFSLLFRALSDSPIKKITFNNFDMDSFEIDDTSVPNNLVILDLNGNKINADGCRQIAKLLRRENATLKELHLGHNQIDDEGISILANALRTNTSLSLMNLQDNEGIMIEGMKPVLKLLNDISSIKATLQSNHTLFSMTFNDSFENTDIATEIRRVLQINGDNLDNPDMTGKLKVIHTQLDSKQRAEMCRLQGVQNSGKPLTEFGPLLLPEVLEIVGKHHGLSECYESFRTCVADLWTIIDRKEVLRQQKAELAIELDALVAKRREVETQMSNIEMEIDLMEQTELSQHAACDGSHKSKRQKIS